MQAQGEGSPCHAEPIRDMEGMAWRGVGRWVHCRALWRHCGFNQQNVDEAGCPPDYSNDIPYPPFHHSTPTATVKSFLLYTLSMFNTLTIGIWLNLEQDQSKSMSEVRPYTDW